MYVVDTELVTKYVNKKKRRKRASIIGAISSIGMTIMIIIAFCLLQVDRFTITTSKELDLSLSIDETRTVLTTTLEAPPLLDADNIQYTDIPENIDEGLGSKNTNNYLAYSFYLIGRSDEGSINYNLTIDLYIEKAC